MQEVRNNQAQAAILLTLLPLLFILMALISSTQQLDSICSNITAMASVKWQVKDLAIWWIFFIHTINLAILCKVYCQ